jgi:Cu(I)/Ag(I) efflux system membrane fusion protein/cobalt-zinc-cadmium efflux system membrane fusion protein
MNKINDDTRRRRPLIRIRVIVIMAIILAGGAGYYLGTMGQHTAHTASGVALNESDHEHDETTLYTCGMHPWILTEEPGTCPICGMALVPKRDDEIEEADAGEREILYWRAPMNPQEIYDSPGKSAMGMDLVPVYEDEVIGGVQVKIDPVTQQNMGIRTAKVERGPLTHTIRSYGHVTYDETSMGQISTKISGWIETLYVDFTGQAVQKGEPLFTIYSPDLVAAQEEYLEALKGSSQGRSSGLFSSSRRRLEYFDVDEEEIRELETSGEVKKNILIRSPFTGVVMEKKAVAGGYVKAGAVLYHIVDLSKVWVEAHIYEYELPLISVGLDAEMSLPYLPGKVYKGRVSYIYPYLQKKTRDVVIRLEFENRDGGLKPDMYADVYIKTSPGDQGLYIPTEAIVRSGERNITFIAREGGKFTPREVTLGISLDGGNTQILSGLVAGETIVTSGQFMLDSESKLKEAVQKMMEMKKGPAVPDQADDFFNDMNMDDLFSDME